MLVAVVIHSQVGVFLSLIFLPTKTNRDVDDTVCSYFTRVVHCYFTLSDMNAVWAVLFCSSLRQFFTRFLVIRWAHCAAASTIECDGSCSDDIICIFNLGLGRYTVALLFPHWFSRSSLYDFVCLRRCFLWFFRFCYCCCVALLTKSAETKRNTFLKSCSYKFHVNPRELASKCYIF